MDMDDMKKEIERLKGSLRHVLQEVIDYGDEELYANVLAVSASTILEDADFEIYRKDFCELYGVER